MADEKGNTLKVGKKFPLKKKVRWFGRLRAVGYSVTLNEKQESKMKKIGII